MPRFRLRVIAILAGVLSVGTPARADDLGTWHDISFDAPVPCSVACPYWLNSLNHDSDANGKEDVYFEACANPDGTADALEGVPGMPFTRGTVYDDVVVGPAPEGTRLLEWELYPTVDWDGFTCEWLPGDVAGNPLEGFWCQLGCTFDCTIETVGIGCIERIAVEAARGTKYILRAYNWSDPMPLTARYRFRGV